MDDSDIPQAKPAPPPELEELVPVTPRTEAPQRGVGLQLAERGIGFKLADWRDLLRNRFILGGLGVLVVLFLVMIVLTVFSSGDGGAGRRVALGDDGTPEAESTAAPQSGLIGSVRTTTTMRIGPGSRYAVLSVIHKGARVPIVGRNEDETWLQVIHPPGSQIRGWVDASFIDVSGDLSGLAVAGPGSGPDVVLPTSEAPWVPYYPTVAPATEPLAPPAATPSPSLIPPTATRQAPPTSTPLPPPTNTPGAPVTPQPTLRPQSIPTPTPGA